MQSRRIVLILAFAAVAALVLPLSAIAAEAYPNGCVSCHTGDKVITKLLAEVKGHPNIAKIIKSVPDGCKMCHKAGAKAPELVTVIHKVHKITPPATVTAASFAGACLNCHAVDAKGVASIKKGAANL